MKKKLLILVMLLFVGLPFRAKGQSQEIQQLVLNIEKLTQFKRILSDMKKGYEILNGGYTVVKDLSQGNFTLHKTFLDGLMQVSPAVKKYRRVGDIVQYQVLLMKESKKGLDRLTNSRHFTPGEIQYFEKICANLSLESLRNLDELMMIITADKLRMSDDERLEAIDAIFLDIQDKLLFLRDFNAASAVLNLQRTKETNDVNTLEGMYDLNN